MCCYNNLREKWIISLVMVGVLFSLGVAVPMILISYPGDECLLFVSVRGESLIYGHPAGCNFISASHCLVAGAALVFFIILVSCRRTSTSTTITTKNPGSASVRSLRGSIAGQSIASSFGPAAKPTITLIVFSTLIFLFVLITAVVVLSGYVVTCGELQYETRRQLYKSLPLGSQVTSVTHWCWSLFRDTDYHTRFHFDHYEYAGAYYGQYTAFRHGRPKTWTGSVDPLMPIALGLEMSLGCSFLGSIIWATITLLLVLHRRSIKIRSKKDIAESIEDARIWTSDMSPAPVNNHYEKISMKNINPQYDTIKDMQINNQNYPPPPSDSSDHDTLLAHQNVIASTHPEGSYFMTNEGQYVQLVNGVLTHVEFQPSPPQSVTYSQPQFQANVMNGVLNTGYHGYPSFNPNQAQSLPASAYQQPPQFQQPIRQQGLGPMGQPMQGPLGQPMQGPMGQPLQGQMGQPMQGPMSQPMPAQPVSYTGNIQPQSNVTRPLMSSSPMSDGGQEDGEDGGPDNTRMNMRLQRDVANAAGIKCSQF